MREIIIKSFVLLQKQTRQAQKGAASEVVGCTLEFLLDDLLVKMHFELESCNKEEEDHQKI